MTENLTGYIPTASVCDLKTSDQLLTVYVMLTLYEQVMDINGSHTSLFLVICTGAS